MWQWKIVRDQKQGEKVAWGNVLNTNPDAISLSSVLLLHLSSLYRRPLNAIQVSNSITKQSDGLFKSFPIGLSSKGGCIVKERIWHHAHCLACHSFIFITAQCEVVELHFSNTKAGTFYCSVIPDIPQFSCRELTWCDIFMSGMGTSLFLWFILRLLWHFMLYYRMQPFIFH